MVDQNELNLLEQTIVFVFTFVPYWLLLFYYRIEEKWILVAWMPCAFFATLIAVIVREVRKNSMGRENKKNLF